MAKIGPVVLEYDAKRTTTDAIAIGHLSDSGDLKKNDKMNLLTGFFNCNMRFEGREEQILDDVKPDTTVGVHVFADFNRMILQM